MMRPSIIVIALTGLSACASLASPSEATLPSGLLELIAAERPGFVYGEHERKDRDGRTYYDVEGRLQNGEEIEFDILMTPQGPQIVEIQRDLDWDDVPAAVQALALGGSGGAIPVRTIESVQTDGAVIYEVFAAGQPAEPAQEIRVKAGEVESLTERWPH